MRQSVTNVDKNCVLHIVTRIHCGARRASLPYSSTDARFPALITTVACVMSSFSVPHDDGETRILQY